MIKKTVNLILLAVILVIFFPSVVPVGLQIFQILFIHIRRVVRKPMTRLSSFEPSAVRNLKKTFILIAFLTVWSLFISSAHGAGSLFQELYNFEDTKSNGWVNDTSNYFSNSLGLPSVSFAQAESDIYSLVYPLNLDAKDSQLNYVHDAGYVTPSNKNFSSYSNLKMYAYIPAEANVRTSAPLYITIYLKTGAKWAWFESKDYTALPLGKWAEVTIDLSNAKNAQGKVGPVAELDKVKELGFHIFGADGSSGTTFLYIDSIQAKRIEQTNPPTQVTGLKVINPGTEIKLNLIWDTNQSPTIGGYCVYRSTAYGETGTLVARRTVNNYTDKDVTEGVNYYYRISAYDLDNREGELSEQIANTPRLNNDNLFLMEGVSYTAWWNDTYEGTNSDDSLAGLSNTGANFVALVITQYMDSSTSNIISADMDKTPTDSSLIHAINSIHSLGMNVLLKPHLDCKDNTWRGDIAPADKTAWFNSYQDFLTHYARLAEDNGVEALSVGCELKTLSGSTYLDQWMSLISNIKNIYHGNLTYAANWDEYQQVAFWNYLDYAGLDAYFPLSDKQNPSPAELIDGWSNYQGIYGNHNWLDELENWQAQVAKPVIFTEIGYRSCDYVARKPWDWQDNNTAYNGELQSACYEAVFSVFKHKDWFKGMFWWTWSPNPGAGGEQDTDYTPQNKPAQTALTTWYHQGKQANNAPQPPAEPVGPAYGMADTYYRYTAKSVDPDGDKIKYIFTWGDGTSDTTEYFNSGLQIGLIHKWNVAGKFNVQVKAIDGEGAESIWGKVIEVEIKAVSSDFKLQAPVDFSRIAVYPNPWKINTGSPTSGIKFDYLPKNTTLQIYNIAGELTYKQNNIESNSTSWDLKNEEGESVASGVYIYLLSDDNGHKKVGKVAVIR